MQAPSQWGAQSGCWQGPRQLDNVELDSSNKAETARLVEASSKPASLAFLVGTAVPPRRSQNALGDKREIRSQETTRKKYNFVLSDVYVRRRKHAFNGCFEKQVQTDNFANRLKCNWAINPC